MRLVLAIVLVVSLSACGDGIVIFSLNSGKVVEDASCRGDGGRFELEEQAGLVIAVVVRADTVVVLANGGAGSCDDIRAGSDAVVQGIDRAGRIDATEILLE